MDPFTEETDLAPMLGGGLGEHTARGSSSETEIDLFSWWDEVGGDVSNSQQSSSSTSTSSQPLEAPVRELDGFPWFQDEDDMFSMDFEYSKPATLDQGVGDSPAPSVQKNRTPGGSQKPGSRPRRDNPRVKLVFEFEEVVEKDA